MNLIADPEQVKHILITARDEIVARGWKQNGHGTVNGPKCTLGAITWAATGNPDFVQHPTPAHLDAELVIGHTVGTRLVGAEWNDDPGRTVDEVLSAFNEGIAFVDEEIERRRLVAERQAAECMRSYLAHPSQTGDAR